jgi:hypothetical protein
MYARRICSLLVVLVAAALVAIGCSSPSSDGPSGGLAMVPADALGVVVVSLDAEHLDESLATLARFPAWGLVESQLPAKDGEGLLEALIDEAFRSEDAKPKLSYADDVKPWLGKQAGSAALGSIVDRYPAVKDPSKIPFFTWIDSTDDEAALAFLKKWAVDSSPTSHSNIDIYKIEDGMFGFVENGAVVITTSEAAAKSTIDALDEDALIDKEGVEAMLDSGDRNEQVAGLVSADVALDLGSKAAQKSTEPGV